MPTKSRKQIAEGLQDRIKNEHEKLPTGPALISTLKASEGVQPSLKTVHRAIELGKDMVFGTEEDSFRKLECYLERLHQANPGSRMLFERDGLGRFLRCLFVAPYAANLLRHGIPCVITDRAHFRKSKYPGMTPTAVCKDG